MISEQSYISQQLFSLRSSLDSCKQGKDMAIGHYIRRGDRTTCGGVVLEGNPSFSMHGVPVARAGDAVTCGKDGQHYVIAGGFQHFMIGGGVAGTLDSVSTCPCSARLIHSLPSATYQSDRGDAQTASAAASATLLSHPISVARVFEKSFAISDSETGRPLVSRKYIALIDGRRVEGLTDAKGIATVKTPMEGAVIELHVVFQAPARELTEFSEAII